MTLALYTVFWFFKYHRPLSVGLIQCRLSFIRTFCCKDFFVTYQEDCLSLLNHRL
jgi:hypothetical protein